MLAELAAANAAYDVIKQTIQNGQEIYAAAGAMAEYFGLKNEIQRKAHEHGYKSDLEAFLALEQMKQQEEELKQMMVWQGRGGMWNDWLDYQAKMKQSREDEARQQQLAKKRRKKFIVNTILISSAAVAMLSTVVGFLYFLFTFRG